MKDNYSIFLADDDPDDHFFFQEALKKINVNCNLTSVYSGMELIDLLLKRDNYDANTLENPDLIILDLNMPLLNGFDTMGKIKSYGKLSTIPIYILSTTQDIKDTKKAMDMGARGFYGKPHVNGTLNKIIAEILISL